MPYQQSYVDPNTGATYPQSYVRVAGAPQVDFNSSRIALQAIRFASVTCYSLGFHPLQTIDAQITGATYASLTTPLTGALASFNGVLGALADTYIGTLTTLSGATPVP